MIGKDRDLKKPEMTFNSPMVCDRLSERKRGEISGYNQCCADWEEYFEYYKKSRATSKKVK